MKQRLSILIIGLILGPTGYSQTNYRLTEIEKVTPKKSHCIEIPSSFSHEKITESNLLKGLQSKKIQRVELIYTRYKENEDFDQNKLNEDRIYRLQQLLPKLQTDKPEIVWIEQTGAKTREEAKTYFHGFRIYMDGEQPEESFQRIELNDLGNPARDFTVDNSKGGNFSHPSGSQIHIPANAVVYENGKPVIGNYTISYREYRNAAEMVFSGIPMEFKDKTGNYQFNSAGMYEIRGTKDGRKLELQKEITVDFNCTKNEPGVNFYYMDDTNGEWDLLKSDLFAQNTAVSTKTQVVSSTPVSRDERVKRNPAKPDETKISYVNTTPYAIITLDTDTRHAYQSFAKKFPQRVEESVAQDLTPQFQLKVRPQFAQALVDKIWEEYTILSSSDNALEFPVKQGKNTLLEGSDKGHQYPNLVSGLNSDKFGVYNCDQIYRLANKVSISPKYLDASTKKPIKDKNILCLIDKNINASFSFDPKLITCDSKGETIFLLFTEKGELFALQTDKNALLDLTKKEPEFLMENITSKIKTSDDLKHYLAI